VTHLYPLDTIKLVLPQDEKKALKRACFVDDTTMAQFIRKAIRSYIYNHPDPKVLQILAKPE
jgi:hypothetical protein